MKLSVYRTLGDAELAEAIATLTRTVEGLALAHTASGIGIRQHYRALLAEALAERRRRAQRLAEA